MDASALSKPSIVNNKVYGFFLIDGSHYSSPSHQKNTIIKYTKLPHFDFDEKVSWPTSRSYTLQPRLRRIITLDNDDLRTSNSLRSTCVAPSKIMTANHTKRKVVTISEDDEHNVYHRLVSAQEKRSSSVKMSNRSIETDCKPEKPSSNRTTSRVSHSGKYTRESKTSSKSNSAYNKNEVNVNRLNYREKISPVLSVENSKPKYLKAKESSRTSRTANQSKHNVSKNLVTPSESVKELTRIKNILYDNLKTNETCKKSTEKPRLSRSPHSLNKNEINFKEITTGKRKQLTITVPLDEKCIKTKVTDVKTKPSFEAQKINTIDQGDNTDTIIQYTHVNIATEPIKLIDRMTEMDDFEANPSCKCDTTVQTDTIKEIFDSLEIPNVTLTKEKPKVKKKIIKLHSASPQTVPREKSRNEDISSSDISFCQSASYVFSRATLTYTTRQKINFHIVDSDEKLGPNNLSSPLDYPVNVVSVLKNELNNKDKQAKTMHNDTYRKNNNINNEHFKCLNEMNSLNCSYVFDKLMKPSDIISTIRINNGLLQNDYICEQFQRELNFIDSFFESLQYLEGCSLTDKCLSDNKVDTLVNNSVLFDSTFDVKNSEYDNFLSKLENGTNVDDTETMASKSLCLLNLLIRDEQRRAKNLLFVLKMREDALKDFTKSQILWLEKKKKQDNTDISTLKKKQRGALLKLQHECGEMQRMRKALLTLSEKRKVALMKTKKNIELKLKNNVHVDNIILSKKKLKRNSPGDRNTSPVKCFDLSSSGCEDSTTSRLTSDSAVIVQQTSLLMNVTSAEKCVQTSDVVCNYSKENHTSNIAAQNFIAVDGGYLNILFHDLMLPQIFSSGKDYEVNEEALKNIVITTNNQTNSTGSEIVEKIMEQIKNRELDISSPSTARSLVEEFDHYYRGLTANDNSTPSSPEEEHDYNSQKVFELRDASVQSDLNTEPIDYHTETPSVVPCNIDSSLVNLSNGNKMCVCETVVLEDHCSVDKETVLRDNQQQTGPLTVPVGAAAIDRQPPDIPTWIPPKSTTSFACDTDSEIIQYNDSQNTSSLTSLPTPVQSEAEELRRQQLAIEREIKALEQQQCRLLVVREIPDKPPPPYTPPTETKPKPPRMFVLDKNSTKDIEAHITEPASSIPDENLGAFDVFLKDFCDESLDRYKLEQSDKPWDACNLLPKKPQIDTQKIVENTTKEIKELLTTVPPTNVSGVSNRRSDHIDDILFAEWRRCEPEWTALHTDEAIVKNQLFESIFQNMLTETIDEYKKTVMTDTITTD